MKNKIIIITITVLVCSAAFEFQNAFALTADELAAAIQPLIDTISAFNEYLNTVVAQITEEFENKQLQIDSLQTQINALEQRTKILEENAAEIVLPPLTQENADIIMAFGSDVSGCELTNDCFIPSEFHGQVAQIITWLNVDETAHTVTSGDNTIGPDWVFHSSLISSGSTYSMKFNLEGTYDYFCIIHPWATGDVIIE